MSSQKSDLSKLALRIAGGILNVSTNLLFYTAVVLLTIYATRYVYNFSYQIFSNQTVEAPPGHDVVLRVTPADTKWTVAGKLEASNVVSNKYSFYIRAVLKSYKLLPGNYNVNTSMNFGEIIDAIDATSVESEEDGS
jgi:cell division protein YceG involved in septum cleavage